MRTFLKGIVTGALLTGVMFLGTGYQQKMGKDWPSPDTLSWSSVETFDIRTPVRTMEEYTVTYTLWTIGTVADHYRKASILTKHVLGDVADTLHTVEYLTSESPRIVRHFNTRTTKLLFFGTAATDSIYVQVVYK